MVRVGDDIFDNTGDLDAFDPNPSYCDYCHTYNNPRKLPRSHLVFRQQPWAPDRNDTCPRCGCGAHQESPAYHDSLDLSRDGRPMRGIAKPKQIWLVLAAAAVRPEILDLAGDLLARHEAGERWHVRKELRKFLGAIQALAPEKVNVTALSEATGISRRTLYDMTKKGRAELAQKSPYDLGGSEMSATEAPTLAQTVNVDHEKRIRELERQVGVPQGGERVAEQAVEQLIEDSLGASTHETDDA